MVDKSNSPATFVRRKFSFAVYAMTGNCMHSGELEAKQGMTRIYLTLKKRNHQLNNVV